jgi:hypothetical protein
VEVRADLVGGVDSLTDVLDQSPLLVQAGLLGKDKIVGDDVRPAKFGALVVPNLPISLL